MTKKFAVKILVSSYFSIETRAGSLHLSKQPLYANLCREQAIKYIPSHLGMKSNRNSPADRMSYYLGKTAPVSTSSPILMEKCVFFCFSLALVVVNVPPGASFEFHSFSSYFKALTSTHFLCLSLSSLFFFVCPAPLRHQKGSINFQQLWGSNVSYLICISHRYIATGVVSTISYSS